MKYKCLVFDHDDTTVSSTASIHHPCFQAYLDLTRPGTVCDLDEYFIKNFSPGFLEMCYEDYGFTDEEIKVETEFWSRYTAGLTPTAYPGIREIMERQKAEGGLVCVVSHSFEWNIRRHFRENGLPEPDAVYGWEYPNEQRKPNPFPLEDIMRRFSLAPSELLVIDDLKPGYDMAKTCGVPFAGAGWAHSIPEIERFMRENCGNYFKSVQELADYLA